MANSGYLAKKKKSLSLCQRRFSNQGHSEYKAGILTTQPSTEFATCSVV